MLDSLGKYLRALLAKWVALITGGSITAAIAVWEHWKGTSVPAGTYSAILALFLFIASFLAWRKRDQEATSLATSLDQVRGRPEVSFTILPAGGELDRVWLFRFLNASESTAVNVTLSPIVQGDEDVVYEFAPIPSLVKSPAPATMVYRVRIGTVEIPRQQGNQDMLFMLTLGRGGNKSYETKLEFSNYGEASRWQVDYRIDCNYENKTMTCVSGPCRKLR